MSYKMSWNAYHQELCDYEEEIKNKFIWKFQSKKSKNILLADIQFKKSMLSIAIKLIDCLQNTVETS